MFIPNYLESIFDNHTKIKQEYEYPENSIVTLTFRTENLGLLKVKKGKIIACDPFEAHEIEYLQPFKNDFPIGNFLCQLAIATIDDADERVAFSRLTFSDMKPIRWEVALTKETNLNEIDQDRIEYELGYSVDSGTGGFMDISAQSELKREMDNNEDYWEIMEQKMDVNYVPTHSSCIWEINDTNIALFSSGFGDGSFLTYIGYDSNNLICRLVTDFGIINDTASFLD